MKVLGFGEVLWDEIDGELKIGGTVFNLIAHCRKFDAEVYFISAVGKDELGKKALETIKSKAINDDFIKIVNVPTCVVKVTLDEKGLPSYYFDENTSWDLITVTNSDLQSINDVEFDYFCFGTLAQRSQVNFKNLKIIFDNCKFKNIFFDMNLRLHYYDKSKIEYSLKKCNILKMNNDEFLEMNNLFGFVVKDYKSALKSILDEFNIDIICITDGKKGAHICSADDYYFCHGYDVKIKDTVGTGDAFSAALIYQLYKGQSIRESCKFAYDIGSIVATLKGAVPDYNFEDVEKIRNFLQ